MRKERSKIVDNAIQTVEGFEKVFKVIHQNTVLKGQSKSTFHNYLRRIALISLHFDRLPENISDDEIKEYLYPFGKLHIGLDRLSRGKNLFSG